MGVNVNTEVVDNKDVFLNALPEQISRALEAIGLAAESHAKEEITKVVYDTPESKSGYVRTGRLRSSISHARDDNAAYIGTNVEYAPYVELGTSKMKERPFLRPAAANYQEEYKSLAEAALKAE